MRTIERTNAFRSDFKREKRGQHRRDLEAMVSSIVSLLVADTPLNEKHRDHALRGEWRDPRECHLKPDLLLIYRKPGFRSLTISPFGFAQRARWVMVF